MSSARHSAIRLLQLMMVASVVLPAVLFVFASWLSFRHEQAVADDRIERSLDIDHEHALKVFQSGERAIAEVEEVIRGMSDDAIVADQRRLRDRLKNIVDAVPQFQAIAVVDHAGRVLASSTLPLPSGISVTDRSYFQSHADGVEGTQISETMTPRWGGLRNPFFTLSRRRVSPDGAFTGVVAIAILPRYFEEFYALIGRSPSDVHALVRSDGTFLARHPPRGDDARPLDPSTALRVAIASGKERALYTVPRSQTDLLERRVGYRKLSGFPVYVVAGIEASAIRAEWLSTMSSHLIFGLPATLLLFTIIGVALQRTRKLHAEADRREAAEDALRQAQHLRAIGQLTGGVAHDFNNLLMIISGSVQRLRREVTEPKQTRLLDMITNATSRGESLTRQLLAFSRRQTLTPAVIDLSERLPELRDMLIRSLRGDITITVVVPHKRCAVKVDPSELELALLNLAVNARDAMPHGGALGITAKTVVLKGKAVEEGLSGEFVAIRVADTGSGIPFDVLPHVFEPFFTTKEVGKGTGLGLSQVYGFAKQSGGTATVSSTVGRGTVITLYLPATHEHPAPSMVGAEPEVAPEPAGTVLLVEDNAEVAEVATAYFEQLGYRVRPVASAQAALESLAADSKVDLVFSDILMPGGMNGLELGHAIAESYPALPVLLASGYSNSARDAVAQGFVVLQKPFDLPALERGLRDARRSKLEAKPATDSTSEPKERVIG
jgi:two-component system, NtrC family, sensor kinase